MRSLERGDTIIEVVFAIVVFSFVAISSLSIMNQGVATGEKALEITLVRQQVNAQAEALRYIHEARVVDSSSSQAGEWAKIVAKGQRAASQYGINGGECTVPSSSFILNAQTATMWSKLPTSSAGAGSPPYSQVKYHDDTVEAAYGIWIEAVTSTLSGADAGSKKPFVDFHIRACWPAPGSDIPMTIGTIVRLYDPS